MATARLQEELLQAGWQIKNEALQALCKEAGNDPTSTRARVSKVLLNADLGEVGGPRLPENVNRAGKGLLKGRFVLQLVSSQDISRASGSSEGGGGGGGSRVLLLK
ncbi:hypothetical protein CYMTET_33112, partial [Cymbomonas tetramitiformis]